MVFVPLLMLFIICSFYSSLFFALIFFYPHPKIFLPTLIDRGREDGRGRKKERNINVREKHGSVASHMYPDWDQTHNLGRCSDQKSNLQPFGVWHDAPPTEPPGRAALVFINHVFLLTLGLIALVFLLS